jgi:nucleotide-binding universal stress UspA family protein
MYKKILVPLDGTPVSAVTLPLARALARTFGAELTLLRAVPGTSNDASAGKRQQARRYLGRIAEEFTEEPFRATSALRHGTAAQAILRAVAEDHHDLVLMATHGRQGIPRAVLGSVSAEVLAHSPVPVLLVKPGGKRVTKVRTLLVPVDGTPGGALALDAAITMARATGARIVLLEVAVPMPYYLAEPMDGGAFIPDPAWDEEARDDAQSYIDGLAERIRKLGLDVATRALIGGIADSIHQVADEEDADLVVMATHAHTGAARAVLGSVADEVVRTAARPVLLVRRDNRVRADEFGLERMAIDRPEVVAAVGQPAARSRQRLGFDPSA